MLVGRLQRAHRTTEQQKLLRLSEQPSDEPVSISWNLICVGLDRGLKFSHCTQVEALQLG